MSKPGAEGAERCYGRDVAEASGVSHGSQALFLGIGREAIAKSHNVNAD